MSKMKLERRDWQRYFNDVSRQLQGRQVEIEVLGLGVGDQQGTGWAPLQGLTYDARGDYLEVATEPLHHRIPHPVDVTVDLTGAQLRAVHVTDGEGNQQFLRFRAPLALPSA